MFVFFVISGRVMKANVVIRSYGTVRLSSNRGLLWWEQKSKEAWVDWYIIPSFPLRGVKSWRVTDLSGRPFIFLLLTLVISSRPSLDHAVSTLQPFSELVHIFFICLSCCCFLSADANFGFNDAMGSKAWYHDLFLKFALSKNFMQTCSRSFLICSVIWYSACLSI